MSNAERDLHRMIPFLFGTQIPSHSVCIDVYNPDTAKVEPLEIPVLLASDVVHAIWEKNSPKLWGIFIGSTAEKSRIFWSAFSTDPAFANHPVLQLLSSIEMFWTWFTSQCSRGIAVPDTSYIEGLCFKV